MRGSGWLSLVVVAACSHDSPAPKPSEPAKPTPVVDAAVAKTPIDAAPVVAVVDAAPLDAPVADVTSSASKSSGSGSAAASGTWKLDGDKLRKLHRDRIAADTSAVTML